MDTMTLTRPQLYGLVELDASGTVLYSRAEMGEVAGGPAPDFAGSNFFTQVAPFANAEELRRRIELFRLSESPAESFAFTCLFDDGPVEVRVLVARIRERSNHALTKSVLMHIRRA